MAYRVFWATTSAMPCRSARFLDRAVLVCASCCFGVERYICEGTLRELVTYPELLPISSQRQTDLLDGLMRTVGLDYLAPREGGWDTPKEFSDILSGGERQRIAIARVLCHNPTYCVLDEATAAVSRDIEVALMEACASNGITMISVSHWPAPAVPPAVEAVPPG